MTLGRHCVNFLFNILTFSLVDGWFAMSRTEQKEGRWCPNDWKLCPSNLLERNEFYS